MFHCLKTSVQQEEGEGKRGSNGTYMCEPPFSRGWVYVPFTKVRPVVPGSPGPSVQMEAVHLSAGDRVTYILTQECGHGMVLGVREKSGQTLVQISTVSITLCFLRNPAFLGLNRSCCCFQDTDENGQTGGEVEVPLQCVAKEEAPAGVSSGHHGDT